MSLRDWFRQWRSDWRFRRDRSLRRTVYRFHYFGGSSDDEAFRVIMMLAWGVTDEGLLRPTALGGPFEPRVNDGAREVTARLEPVDNATNLRWEVI